MCYLKEVWFRGIKGIVFLEVVVEKDGIVVLFCVFWDIGGGCGDEVVCLVKVMFKWVFGKNGGKIVCVKIFLIVKFG